MKKGFSFIFIFLFFITIGLTLPRDIASSSEKKQNILVIHSYHSGLSWTDLKNQGILEAARGHHRDVNIFIEHLDWKNNPSQENLALKYQMMKYKYEAMDIDILITTDDAALEFAIRHREEMFSNAPIVFTGVSRGNAEIITRGQKDITGVIEEADIENTLKLAKALYPDLENIYVIYDHTESGIAMGNQAMDDIRYIFPHINIFQTHERHIDDIVNKANRLPENSAVLLTVFYNDEVNTIMGFQRNARYIVENVKDIPVFILYDFNFGTGALGGSLISGYLQGQIAFDVSVKILSGTDPNTIPYTYTESIKQKVDFHAMERLGITMSQVPANIDIINRPLTLMDTHSHLIYSFTIILVALLIFILILSYYLRRLVFLKGSLEEKNREQARLYDDLAASEEELQAQLEELHTTYEELASVQDKLNYMAYHDFLTGLNNRAGFMKRFEALVLDKSVHCVDIIILDIDNFKLVNDTMGHIFGDKLIREVGVKISKIIEPQGEIYRIGGDEFIMIIPCNVTGSVNLTAELLDRVRAFFKKPLEIDKNPINVSFSMGLVSYPQHGKNPDDLLKKADIAMYKSKESNKGSLTVFTDDMLQRLKERKRIAELLQEALDKKEFYLNYQPQLDVNEKKVWGVEALIRWNSPHLGFVPPSDFINIAEENQTIIQIGQWVL